MIGSHKAHYIIKHIQTLLKKDTEKPLVLLILLAGILFVINAGYVSYPDEFVNLLGAKFILNGRLPYTGFFDHHMPFAWILGSGIMFFSFKSFVIFRFLWTAVMFLTLFLTSEHIRKIYPQMYKSFMLFFVLYPLIAVYSWLHVYLADSLSALWVSVALWLLLSTTYAKKNQFKTLIYISLSIAALVLSSMTYVYVAMFLYLWLGYIAWNKLNFSSALKITGISLIPYVLFGAFLFITGTWSEFWHSNFVYNTSVYIDIPNYTKGRFFNPLKFLLTLIFNFHETYLVHVISIRNPNLFLPLASLLAWSTFVMLFVLFFENKIVWILYFLMLSVSAPRSDLRNIKETDYQAAVYIIIGITSGLVVLWRMDKTKLKNEFLDLFRKVAGLLLVALFIFTFIFLTKNMYDKAYKRYTQVIPGIYDLPDTRNFADQILGPDEKYWIGPYEPHEIFYIPVEQLPGKFPTLLLGFRQNEKIKKEFINQFEDTQPTLIILKNDASMFGTGVADFGDFFFDWLKKDYVRIEDIGTYHMLKSPTAFRVDLDLFIRKDKADEVIEKLVNLGYIREK